MRNVVLLAEGWNAKAPGMRSTKSLQRLVVQDADRNADLFRYETKIDRRLQHKQNKGAAGPQRDTR